MAEPTFTRCGSRPIGLATMGQPVSVCHQWSTMGTSSTWFSHSCVGGSSRSPARYSVRSVEMSYCRRRCASGSSFLMARNAVGAVKKALTP